MNKEHYRKFCKLEKNIPVFSRDWWLDAVCGEDNWDICLVEKDNKILGSLPYYNYKKFGYTFLSMPPLTPYLGPQLFLDDSIDNLSLEKQINILTDLISQLPKYNFFNQSFNPNVINWLPFYWAGFRQTTRYTYFISRNNTEEYLWNNFRGRVRRNIRKAQNKYFLEVGESDDIEKFYSLNKLTFTRNKMKMPYNLSLISRIDAACKQHKCRKIYMVTNSQNEIFGAIYVIWDEYTTYYLMGGNDPELINSGASSLLLWEAIKFSIKEGRNFDFEGSMLPGVEKYFRGFNPDLREYHRIYKANSFLLSLYLANKSGF